jgi:hypothetical protein
VHFRRCSTLLHTLGVQNRRTINTAAKAKSLHSTTCDLQNTQSSCAAATHSSISNAVHRAMQQSLQSTRARALQQSLSVTPDPTTPHTYA